MSRKKQNQFGGMLSATKTVTQYLPPAPVAKASTPLYVAPAPVAAVTPVVTSVTPAVQTAVKAVTQNLATFIPTPTVSAVTPATPSVQDAVKVVSGTSGATAGAIKIVQAQPSVSAGAGSGGGGSSPATVYEESPEGVQAPDYMSTEPQYPERQTMVQQPTSELSSKPTALSSKPVLATTSTPVGTKNIFVRIWEFFFGSKDSKPVASPPVSKVAGELDYAAESLVKRARFGDQNAMAIIDLVRKNRYTNESANKTYTLIETYIRRNPVPGVHGEMLIQHGDLSICHMNGEKANSVTRAAARLANGPPITGNRLRRVMSEFGTESRERNAVQLAQAIQNVRRDGSYISEFNLRAGWELGE